MIDRPGLEEIEPGGVADGTYAVTVVSNTITNLTLLTTSVASVVAGANVTVDSTDPAHPIVSAAGTRELLMQDGVSSPPVPLTTEDGTDWLYEG